VTTPSGEIDVPQAQEKAGARFCKINDFQLTATDLVGSFNCRNLTELDIAFAEGTLTKPLARGRLGGHLGSKP
jgi:hypothetical protein